MSKENIQRSKIKTFDPVPVKQKIFPSLENELAKILEEYHREDTQE